MIRGALARPTALGIRALDYKILSHPGHDGGVRKGGAQLLGVGRSFFQHGLLLLDHEGSGAHVGAVELEAQLDGQLSARWGDAAKAIVIDPEVDAWMWGAEPHLRSLLDWTFQEGIREWLVGEAFGFTDAGKPTRPKEAFEAACRRARMPRSSEQYRYVAERISLQRCEDPAFQRLRAAIVGWFATPDIGGTAGAA